jgi:hypothetical protein
MPEHGRTFGGGASESFISPIVLVAMFFAVLLIVFLPRKYAIVPMTLMLFLIPPGQQLVVAGFHFYIFRILLLAGLTKLLVSKFMSRSDVFVGGLNSIDQCFLWCTLCQVLAAMILFLSAQVLFNQIAFVLDYLGGYFVLRFLLQDKEDIYRMIKCFAVVVLVLGTSMAIEHFKEVNLFGLILGGVPSVPDFRDGKVRAQGTFMHEILAGSFGATLVPLFIQLWKSGKAKMLAAIGVIGASVVVWTSNSSTSLLAYVAGLLAIAFWPARKHMRMFRWGLVFGLFALQIVMKAPVWFVIAHIDLTGSSSSYHRAEVVDQFIRHFSDWCLVGVKETGSWGWDMWDTQNQFASIGVSGGLLALILFIAMITYCFKKLGSARKAMEGRFEEEWLFWLLGSALFAHTVGFFGVNYFDQTRFAWFALLASITAATVPALQAVKVPESQPKATVGTHRLAYPPLVPSRSMASGSNHKSPAHLRSRIS